MENSCSCSATVPSTFSLFVYSSGGQVEPMADAASFQILKDGVARDKKHTYEYMDVLEVVE